MDTSFTPETTAAVGRVRRQSLGDLLHRTARRHPDKLAVVAGEQRATYAEFDAAVNRCAHALADRGLAKGDRLALLSHNCWEFAVLTYATARQGVVLVPVNFMLGPAEIAFILQHSGARGMVVEDALVPTAEKALASAGVTGGIRGFIGLSGSGPVDGWEDVDPWWREGPDISRDTSRDTAPDVDVADDDPLRLMYTSGTESRPKGVLLSSRSLIAQYLSCVVDGGMSADDVEVHSLPMYHCAQLDCFLGPDVYLGATSIILPGPDAALLLATIERERVTKLFCPPTVWISLLRHPDFDSTDLSSLRKGYYGASPMPVEVLRELQRRLPDVALWNFYGQTELAPIAAILGPQEQLAWAGSAGRPALNVETVIVDEFDEPVPPGEVGEIVHRSPHAALGYYQDDQKTAETYRGGWFHSGDLGVMSPERLLDHRRPQEGHDQDGWRERGQQGGRGGPLRAGRSRRGRRVRHQPPALDRGRDRGRRAQAGQRIARRARAGARPHHARPVQAPEVRRPRGRAAEEPERQGPQAGPARAVRRPGHRGTESFSPLTEE